MNIDNLIPVNDLRYTYYYEIQHYFFYNTCDM